MIRRTPAVLVCTTAAALVLGACSSGGAQSAPPEGVSEIAPPVAAPAPAPAPGGAAQGAPGRPSPDQCVAVPEAPDGVYPVFEAGSATVVREGDRLVLVGQEAAAGWTARVDEAGPEEVEIDFRQGAQVLDLEVELDDGRVEARICADDD